ncbi:hypothetical protein K8I61_07345 [bacterium]|nr:hypothetical protein [bacterium]
MTGTIRKRTPARPRHGYALVAALMVMLMLTLLGIMAMITSTSEQRIVNNLGEEQLIEGFGKQGVDRVLSHLHYLPMGLFGQFNGGAQFVGTNAAQVLDNVRNIYMFNPAGPLNLHPDTLVLSAWLDPKDYEGAYDRSPSREVHVNVLISNAATGFRKAFRAQARPYSIWDLAYFSQEHNPAQRASAAGCGGASNSWYGCQTVFHNEDRVIGDTYVRTAAGADDNTILYMRGGPTFAGQVMWRNLRRYDYGSSSLQNSDFQTKGGSNPAANALPRSQFGFRNYSKEVGLFPIDYLESGDTPWFRANSDIILNKRSNRIWKIVFRNDFDTDDNGQYEAESRVTSRINNEVNNGNSDSTDPGTFHLYSLPWTTPTQAQMIAAFYGDNMRERHAAITSAGGEIWTPAVSWDSEVVDGGGKCYSLRRNEPGGGGVVTKKPAYDQYDIQNSSYYFFTPSIGVSRGTWPDGNGTCSGTSSGIIYVHGDVLVEGIHDGKTTIVATGNIWLSHEVQYEEHPSRDIKNATSPNAIDMLGLFATGNVIIPNSYPSESAYATPNRSMSFRDDWSDSTDGFGGFVPTGNLDHPKMLYDDGNEEVHAVMVSFGHGTCTTSGSNSDCPAPTTSALQNFQTGLYATPRTTTGLPGGAPYLDPSSGTYSAAGNDSGILAIWGAVIQQYPGRVSFDHATSSGTNGTRATVRNLGHPLVINYDPHLKYTIPPAPYYVNASRGLPYGHAAWETVSWAEIEPSDVTLEAW